MFDADDGPRPLKPCTTRHAGPFTLRANGGSPIELLTEGGGSSCLVSLTGPQVDAAGNFVNYQGLTAQLLGLQGSTWVPLRNGWAPPAAIGTRQLLQYQGAAVQCFKVSLFLQSSGIDPTTWATVIESLHVDITHGDAGSGGVAPGGSFLLTGRTGVLPAGSDTPQVGASPERRRLTVELLSTTAAGGVGLAWSPLDASPATWVPLTVGNPRTFETTAPVWIASDPPASPSEISVIEELA